MIKLDVILLCWNDIDQTEGAADAVLHWLPENGRLWIVDNGSAPPCKIERPRTTVLRSEENRGFSGGVNLALAQIMPRDSDGVMLLNTDCLLTRENAEALIDILAQNDHIDMLSPLLEESDRRQTRCYAGARDIAQHIRTRRPCPKRLNQQPPLLSSPYLSGTCLVCRTGLFKKLGLFDEDFFFSGEVADFCKRAAIAGFRAAVTPDAKVRHHLTRSMFFRDSIHAYYSLRNRFLFIRKHTDGLRRHFYVMKWTGIAVIQITFAAIRGRGKLCRALVLALIDGLRGITGNRNQLFNAA